MYEGCFSLYISKRVLVQLVQLVQFVNIVVFKGNLTRLLNQHGAFFVGSAGRFVGSLPASEMIQWGDWVIVFWVASLLAFAGLVWHAVIAHKRFLPPY